MARFTCPNCSRTVYGYTQYKSTEHQRECKNIKKLEGDLKQAKQYLRALQSQRRGAGASPQRVHPPRTPTPRDDLDEQIVDQAADTASDALSIASEHETGQRITELEAQIATMKQRIEREAQSSREAAATEAANDDPGVFDGYW